MMLRIWHTMKETEYLRWLLLLLCFTMNLATFSTTISLCSRTWASSLAFLRVLVKIYVIYNKWMINFTILWIIFNSFDNGINFLFLQILPELVRQFKHQSHQHENVGNPLVIVVDVTTFGRAIKKRSVSLSIIIIIIWSLAVLVSFPENSLISDQYPFAILTCLGRCKFHWPSSIGSQPCGPSCPPSRTECSAITSTIL